MRGKALAPPLLLAAYPILALYSHNFLEVRLADVLAPLAVSLAVALVLLAVLTPVVKSALRAGLLVSLFFLATFAYAGALQGTRQLLAVIGIGHWIPNRIFLPLWGLAFVVSVVAVLRTRRRLEGTVRFFTIAGVALVGVAVIQIGAVALGSLRGFDSAATTTSEDSDGGALSADPIDESVPVLTPPDPAPDVYYIVFDRYAGTAGLREFFDFDNAELLGFLRARGFVVPDSAITNYPMTHTSLASSLNMEYLGPNFLGPVPYARMLDRHRVGQAFKQAGYRYYHLGSWYEFTGRSQLADENARFARYPSEFVAILAQTTVFYPLLPKDDAARQVLFSFSHLARMPREPGPKFVFAHIISPHPPYVFQADGSPLDPAVAATRTEKENYLGQLRHVNRRIKTLVDEILEQSATSPIIIIQADEGPLVFAEEKGLNEEQIWQWRASILNAYRFPGPGSNPPPGMTPVNTFRYVFNRYFGTSLPMLEDRLLFWSDVAPNGKPKDPKRPFPFVDITKRYRAAIARANQSGADS